MVSEKRVNKVVCVTGAHCARLHSFLRVALAAATFFAKLHYKYPSFSLTCFINSMLHLHTQINKWTLGQHFALCPPFFKGISIKTILFSLWWVFLISGPHNFLLTPVSDPVVMLFLPAARLIRRKWLLFAWRKVMFVHPGQFSPISAVSTISAN